MKIEIGILYNSGIEEKITQECNEKELENITNIINSAFKEGVSAVIRLNDERELRFISLSQVSRVIFKEIESE